MINQYVKKPVVVSAILWTGNNEKDVLDFMSWRNVDVETEVLRIHTLEGVMIANVGDYIIKGVSGEFYPCKPSIFKLTYDII